MTYGWIPIKQPAINGKYDVFFLFVAQVKVAKLHVLLPISPPWGGYPSDHYSLGGGKDYSLVDRGLWEHEATYVGKTKGTGKNKQQTTVTLLETNISHLGK